MPFIYFKKPTYVLYFKLNKFSTKKYLLSLSFRDYRYNKKSIKGLFFIEF